MLTAFAFSIRFFLSFSIQVVPVLEDMAGWGFSRVMALTLGCVLFNVFANFGLAVFTGPGYVEPEKLTADMQRRLGFDPCLRRGEMRRWCNRCKLRERGSERERF